MGIFFHFLKAFFMQHEDTNIVLKESSTSGRRLRIERNKKKGKTSLLFRYIQDIFTRYGLFAYQAVSRYYEYLHALKLHSVFGINDLC
jgi:hypothetical protein